MAIQKISEEVLLAELPFSGSKTTEELETIKEMISDQRTYDVVIDFFKVELFNSWNIGTLLELRSMLLNAGHQLVLCNVRVVTKSILTVAGLRKIFTFADNKKAALETLSNSKLPISTC